MPKSKNRAVMIWLFAFAFVVAFLVVFGGFVRLTRSGLSVVEWNPVSGIFPPIGEQAWQNEFAKYQLTPEFLKVNHNITLEQYQRIFYIEWLHRLIARLAGLFYAIPVFYFLIKGAIPLKEFGIYVLMGLLFIGQAFMGWFMVASGLIDRPSVSHFRLTLHLLLALSLFALSLWVALGHRNGFPDFKISIKRSGFLKLAITGMIVLLVQISYGGFTAGLKAGHVSNTWPLMFGKWLPAGLFSNGINLLKSPQTIVFVHRWFAFVALIFGIALYFLARKQNYHPEITRGLLWILGLGSLQIVLGVLVVLLNVQISLALLHQLTAVLLFGWSLILLYRLRILNV
ncbi:MAG: COX15/CtaA family protein [Anaerolineales bacterium]|uniref:COX15/CtaA family protein n=1 Tax=Candidatus Desulfolinea nitratireducens TaxID=2841698 RepID=A0A8J6TE26_9CHLR|nr:COX15/CtaA family protein [Candidatus Desulfolinea nitratireducens]